MLKMFEEVIQSTTCGSSLIHILNTYTFVDIFQLPVVIAIMIYVPPLKPQSYHNLRCSYMFCHMMSKIRPVVFSSTQHVWWGSVWSPNQRSLQQKRWFSCSFHDFGCFITGWYLYLSGVWTLLLLQGVVIKNRTAHASVIETQTLENFTWLQRDIEALMR